VSDATGTQVSAYRHLIESGALTEMQAQVLDRYREYGPCTRRDLVEKTDLMYNNVSGRTNELLEDGFLTVDGERENSSGRSAEVIAVTNDNEEDDEETCRYIGCNDPVETVKTVNDKEYGFCSQHG